MLGQQENSQSFLEDNEAFRTFLESVSDGVLLIDEHGTIVSLNKVAEQFFGYRPDQLISHPLRVLIEPSHHAAFEGYLASFRYPWVAEVMGRGRREMEGVRRDGSRFQIDLALAEIRHAGNVIFVCMVRDITLRKRDEEFMQLAVKIYQSSAEAIMITDENHNIIDINPAFTRHTGYTLEEVAGKNIRSLQSGYHDPVFYQEMWRSVEMNGFWQGEIWDRHKNGAMRIDLLNISVIRHPGGKIYRYVLQFFDITDKKQKEEQIWNQANYDSLTGLPNRNLLHDRLQQEIRKSNRTHTPLALLLIDLDRFKEVNDTLGHAKGDVLLKEAARRIRSCIRETDMAVRLGGDEFTVILPEFRDRRTVERIASSIIRALARPFDLGGNDHGHISASIGITIFPDDAADPTELLKHADQAMYVAKAEGRNRFGYFTESMQREAEEKLALTKDLRLALSRNELEVYYQPILEISSGRIVKAEALLRWNHPQRGLINPGVFIPLAEESGLIHEIGEWVFQKATASIESWRRQFGRLIQISVNKSPVQFDQVGQSSWPGKLASYGLAGSSITAEITEGLLLKKSTKVKQRLQEFRKSGIQLSIDDFGTGFSALSYLKEFHIDYLKIDRTFIKDLTRDSSDKALTEAIIVMAHKLGIKVIAEGVETEEQLKLLMDFGCDYMQGFLCSRPVPEEEFVKLLAADAAR